MSLFGITLRKLETSLLSILKTQRTVSCRNNIAKCSSLSRSMEREEKDRNILKLKKAGRFLIYFGAGSGLVIYGTKSAKTFSTAAVPIVGAKGQSSYILDGTPPIPEKLAASYKNPNDKSGLKITLYQYMTCPFCCKVRAFLNFYGFSYDIVEVNSVTRKQTKWTKYRKVPFLVVQEESSGNIYQLKDSSLIISALASYVTDTKNLNEILDSYPVIEEIDDNDKKKEVITNRYCIMYPQFPKHRNREDIKVERKWRKWVDDDLVHILSPNVYRTFEEAKQAFTWFAKAGKWEDLFPKWELTLVHYVGSTVMYYIAKRLKKRHNIRDDVRQALYDSSNIWTNAIISKNTKFMGGDEANLSDISVYGVLTAIEGCDAFNDMLKNTKINQWYQDMNDATKNKLGSHYVAQSRS